MEISHHDGFFHVVFNGSLNIIFDIVREEPHNNLNFKVI